jgi:hypothetical protein
VAAAAEEVLEFFPLKEVAAAPDVGQPTLVEY